MACDTGTHMTIQLPCLNQTWLHMQGEEYLDGFQPNRGRCFKCGKVGQATCTHSLLRVMLCCSKQPMAL